MGLCFHEPDYTAQQYRVSYDFFVPPTYTSNFINITTPTGTTFTMDGAGSIVPRVCTIMAPDVTR